MNKQKETDAELIEQIRSNVRPLREPRAPFRDDPSDIAWHIRDNALHNIDAGQDYISEVTLPYLEDQAIARFRELTSYRPTHEADKRKEPELWRQKWVCEALAAEAHINGLEPIAQAAVRVLLTASRLRSALEDKDNPQKIAALSMLLGCAVFEGGYMLEAEATKQAFKKTSAENKKLANKPKITASLGGRAKADKYLPLQAETLRLFKEGSWSTTSAAAVEILPKVITFGRQNDLHVLSASSKKPFEWISEFKKA